MIWFFRKILFSILVFCISLLSWGGNLLDRNKESPQNASDKVATLSRDIDLENLPSIIEKIESQDDKEKVLSLVESYYPMYISDIDWKNGDVVYTMNGTSIWYSEGRLLSDKSIDKKDTYRGILYPYSIDNLYSIFDDLPKPRKNLSQYYIRSSDFQQTLVGGSPREIESQIKNYRVLGITVRLHPIAGEQAVKASRDILDLAHEDEEISSFVKGLKTMSGYSVRTVSQSSNISMHAFGLAFDFIPYDYNNKVSYWQWARALYPDTWDSIPLERRWLVPDKVVEIFEDYGFIWGGKWPNYDTIHFEYRPELIAYARVRESTGTKASFRRNIEEEAP